MHLYPPRFFNDIATAPSRDISEEDLPALRFEQELKEKEKWLKANHLTTH